MKRIRRIIERSNGAITHQSLADAVGKARNEITEYLNVGRSAPNSETTLRLLRWAGKAEKKGKKQ